MPSGLNFGEPWTEAELALVRLNYGRASRAELQALLPGRTWRTIGMRAVLLGVSQPQRKQFNRHDVDGDTATIWLERRGADAVPCLVTTSDLPLLMQVGGWGVDVKPKNGAMYARRHRIHMHRFLLGAPTGMDVDHVNGNTLDNRRANLRLVTRSENAQNRAPGSFRGQSGIPNVHWNKALGLWVARVKVNGRSAVKYSKDIEIAARYARELRAALMPNSRI